MKKINFVKMVASGNDFAVVSGLSGMNLPALARKICDRKYGVGADGMLLVDKGAKASAQMRIFNADGSEASMCGNGARCSALYLGKSVSQIKTRAGVINARLHPGKVRIQLTDPKDMQLNIPLNVNGRNIQVDFINTGVPHAVVFVSGIEGLAVTEIGRAIRNHPYFAPAGTNADFVEELGGDKIRVRTYERGVEDETLACGTGSTASALIFAVKSGADKLVQVATQSGEVLKIYFKRNAGGFSDVWLEGSARIVYKGEYYV